LNKISGILVRWPENSAGVRESLCGEALNFLEFFGSFLFQDKNEQTEVFTFGIASFYEKALARNTYYCLFIFLLL